MEISKELVIKISNLSRLEIEDVDKFTEEFKEIVKYFEILDNFKGIKELSPLVNPTQNTLRLREDIVKEGLNREEVLKGSNTIKENHFEVPKIIGNEEEA